MFPGPGVESSVLDLTFVSNVTRLAWCVQPGNGGSGHILFLLVPSTYCPRVVQTHQMTTWDAFRLDIQHLTGVTAKITAAISTSLQLSTKLVTITVKHPTPELQVAKFTNARRRTQRIARRTNAPEV